MAVVWRERSQPVCVGIPTQSHTCCSRGASWALLSAWLWGKSQDSQGFSSSFLGRLSYAMARDSTGRRILFCMPPFSEGQKDWKEQRSRSKWWSQPCPAVFCFLSALLWESSSEAEKHNRARAVVAVWYSCHVFQPLPVEPGIGEVVAGGLPEKEWAVSWIQEGTQLSPSQVTGQQGTWMQGEGVCRQTGLFALKQFWHPDLWQYERLSLGVGRAHGSTVVLLPSFVWHNGSDDALLSAEGHSMEILFGENNLLPSFFSFLYSPCEKQQAERVSLLVDNLRITQTHHLLPGTGYQEERQLLGLHWEWLRGCSHHTARPQSRWPCVKAADPLKSTFWEGIWQKRLQGGRVPSPSPAPSPHQCSRMDSATAKHPCSCPLTEARWERQPLSGVKASTSILPGLQKCRY